MTKEEIQQKADELSQRLGVKVHPLVFVTDDTEEQVVGYMKEPTRVVKMRAYDKAISGSQSFAGEELLEVCLVKDESDKRILSEDPANDALHLGACFSALSLVRVLQNQINKKK